MYTLRLVVVVFGDYKNGYFFFPVDDTNDIILYDRNASRFFIVCRLAIASQGGLEQGAIYLIHYR